ncbi:CPBP family intramembrane glutamic endopeptidase [Halomicroarcula sp. GCM10025324]|jgi:membrane protease YdiL (CAAX protease family)|uniref:CPBP family intramembrane glutamic endopeptidase n=1 Tax=Haloarcula TaxID=2237 RepID=UPI0023E81536|nr:CPBP family intramembrane glutamic endopeptidase [Halomicroarcula sp. ZS-22-S1]
MEAVSRERPAVRSAVALVAAVGLGGGGLFLGFVLALVAALALTAAGIEVTPVRFLVLSLVFVQGVGSAGVALTYRKYRPRLAPKVRSLLGLTDGVSSLSLPAAVPSIGQVVIVGVGYVAALGAAMVGGLVVSTLDVQTGQNAAAELGMQNPDVLLLLIPASILVIGPGEELLFRGVVQGRLREVFGWKVAVVLASVIFAGLHWFALSGGSATGNLVVLGVLLGPAIVFGLAYEYTDNIVVPSLIHGIYNATLFTALYVSITSGMMPEATLLL